MCLACLAVLRKTRIQNVGRKTSAKVYFQDKERYGKITQILILGIWVVRIGDG
jgi:hypothetical protein